MSTSEAESITSKEDLLILRDGPFLPCKYNVPNAVSDNLLCAACAISKATRRKPTIRTAGRQIKEMILKENHLQPGDCVSCDHYISPVLGRVVSIPPAAAPPLTDTSGAPSTSITPVAGYFIVLSGLSLPVTQ